MNVQKTIGENIKSLLDKQNISIRKLAEVINVTHPTMSSYIKGENTIDSEKLMIIARYFNKKFDYFFESEYNELPIMFRADKPNENVDEDSYEYIRTRIEAYTDIVVDNVNFIPPCYNLNIDGKPSEDNEEAIERIAYELRRLLDIENHIPENYFSVLSSIGFNVICYDLENPSLYGASSYIEGKGSYIFVNTNKAISFERQIFSMVHELGHLIFHRSEYQDPKHNPYYKTTRGDVREKVVDLFAGYFLLPRYMVEEFVSKNANGNSIPLIEMKKYFKVSIQTLVIALKKYEIISPKASSNFWKKLTISGYKKTEPNPMEHMSFQLTNTKLMKNLKKLYQNDEISVNKIAEVLDKDILKARQIAKDWSQKNDRFDLSL